MASPNLSRQLLGDIVAANRILSAQGVLDAWGHVSMRDPNDPRRYWMSRSMAPALVTASDIMAFDLDSKPIGRQSRKMYIERFIHGEIYKARPDVTAVVHNHAPALIPFGITGVPETFLIGADGSVIYRFAGPLTREVLAQTFAPLAEAAKQ